MLIKINRLI